MVLSKQLKDLGYDYINDISIRYNGTSLGASVYKDRVEKIIKSHMKFIKEKDNYIDHPNKNNYIINWHDSSLVSLRHKNEYSIIGICHKDKLNKLVLKYESFLNNEFHISLTKEQKKEGYSLHWNDTNNCFLGYKEPSFFGENKYKIFGSVKSNSEIKNKIIDFKNKSKEKEEEIDFEF